MTRNKEIDYDVYNAYSPIAIVISNGEGIILGVNPKTEQLFGFETGELIGGIILFFIRTA